MIRYIIVGMALITGVQSAIAQEQAGAGPAEEEKPWSVDVTASFVSAYMFRGQNLYDGMSFQPSIQPSYSLGEYGNLSGLLWMHIPADGYEEPDKYVELDEGITYDFTYSRFTFSAGHYWYTYPNRSDDIRSTREFFTSVSIETMMTPTLTFYQDYAQYDYQYYELNLSHVFEHGGENGYNFMPFVSFGFASNAEKVYADDGLVQTTLGVSSDLALGDITLTPTLAQTISADDLTVDEFWMGLAAKYSF